MSDKISLTDSMESPVSPDPAALGALSQEEQALVAGIHGRLPAERSIDWTEFMRLVHIHGVGPLLHRTWSSAADAIPPDVLAKLLLLRRQHTMRSMISLRERDQALRTLGRADVPCLVLKGGALARRWYGDISLRPIADVDLLVPVSEAVRARQALMEAGYRGGSREPPTYHDLPLEMPGSPSSIELHYELTDLQLPHPIVFEDLHARAVALDGPDALVRTLGPEDTLVHLCIHVLRHVSFDGGWTLLQLSDIARHLEAFSIDWELFDERTDETGLGHAGSAVLSLAALLCGARVPDRHRDRGAAQRLLHHPARVQVLESYYEHRRVLEVAEALSRMAWHEPAKKLFRWLLRLRSGTTATPMHVSDTQPAQTSRLRTILRDSWWLVRRSRRKSRSERYYLTQGIAFIRRRRQASELVNDLLTVK